MALFKIKVFAKIRFTSPKYNDIILKEEICLFTDWRFCMEYNTKLSIGEDLKDIENLEEKKEVAKKIVDKVKDGQVIRIWIWINIIYCNN